MTRMTPAPSIKPGPHWWKTSALTTAPSLLPFKENNGRLENFACEKLFRF